MAVPTLLIDASKKVYKEKRFDMVLTVYYQASCDIYGLMIAMRILHDLKRRKNMMSFSNHNIICEKREDASKIHL